MSKRAKLVIPCFNEAQRLDHAGFTELLADPELDLVFVNDGSTDATDDVLHALAMRNPERMSVISLAENQGKAEAVRRGLLHALDTSPGIVGYADADLATPPRELLRLIALMRNGRAEALLGSRVALLGRNVDRSPARHYLGRMFATVASLALNAHVYDTQCGAKLFRTSRALRAALSEPFNSRWAFDVELLGRLLTGSRSVPGLAASSFVEEPLREWHDIAGSKLGAGQMLRAVTDLARIGRDLARRRKAKARG